MYIVCVNSNSFQHFFLLQRTWLQKLTNAEQDHKCAHIDIRTHTHWLIDQYWCCCTHSLSFIWSLQFKLYGVSNIIFICISNFFAFFSVYIIFMFLCMVEWTLHKRTLSAWPIQMHSCSPSFLKFPFYSCKCFWLSCSFKK